MDKSSGAHLPKVKPGTTNYLRKQCGCGAEIGVIAEQIRGEHRIVACGQCGRFRAWLPKDMTESAIGAEVYFFGKHKGKTIAEVAKIDGQYIEWCQLNMANNRRFGDKAFFYYLKAEGLLAGEVEVVDTSPPAKGSSGAET